MQQGSSSAGPQAKLEVSQPGDAFEVEADRAADAMVTGAPATIGRSAAAMIARDTASGDEKKPPAPAANDILDAGEAALNAGNTHVRRVPADMEGTKWDLLFDDQAVQRLVHHLITTWLKEANPTPLFELPDNAQPMVPPWVPRFRVKALSAMKDDPADKKRLSQLATKLADAVAEKTAGEKFREDFVAKATPGQQIMSQAAIDAQQDKTTAGKFSTCIEFAGQMINTAPRPKDAPKLPKFSGPNDYKEVNPAAKKKAREVFPEGTWHDGIAGMTERPKPGDLLILGFAKATPYGEGAKKVTLPPRAFAHINILRAIQSDDATKGETWITTDGGGTQSTQGTYTYHVDTNILSAKYGDRLLLGWFDIVRMAGL